MKSPLSPPGAVFRRYSSWTTTKDEAHKIQKTSAEILPVVLFSGTELETKVEGIVAEIPV
jgi:hypothetical protein